MTIRFNWCGKCKRNTDHKQVKKGKAYFKCLKCGEIRYG